MGTIIGNKEIIYVAESIAHEKGLAVDDIITAMENGIKIAARKKYGNEVNIECFIDHKTGSIKLFNVLTIIPDVEAEQAAMNDRQYITLSEAKERYDDSVEVGDEVEIELPPLDLNRIFAQVAREEITKTVKEAEKRKEYEAFKNRIGEVVHGVVLKEGVKNVVVGIEGYEAVLHADQMIRGEKFKVGDRVKSYILDVRQEPQGAQIFLSRTDGRFMAKLFAQEVPEVFDGLIEIKSVARDPGSRAKIAVFSKEASIDVVGACIGVRGTRVQSVSNELKGEKIDVIKWSDNLAEFAATALTPAKVSKVILDEENEVIEVVVMNDQLSLAIGRGGQNVRLASQLVGYKIDIMTEEEEKERRSDEFTKATKLFIEALDVEELIAQFLAAEGYYSVEEIADAELNNLKSIEGFNEEIATELQQRAKEYLRTQAQAEVVVEETDAKVASSTSTTTSDPLAAGTTAEIDASKVATEQTAKAATARKAAKTTDTASKAKTQAKAETTKTKSKAAAKSSADSAAKTKPTKAKTAAKKATTTK